VGIAHALHRQGRRRQRWPSCTARNLHCLGVEAHIFIAPGCSSQQAFILVDDSGERTVLWKRDERLTLRPEELQQEWIVNSRALHVDGHDTIAATKAVLFARSHAVPTIADLDELYPDVEALLKNIDYLIASRDIPGRLMGEPDLRKSLPAVRERFGCRLTAAHHWAKKGYWPGMESNSTTLRRFASARGHHWRR